MKKLVIIGAGDLSLDLVENIERDKLYKIHGFIDKKKKGMYCGYPILSKDINDVKNAEKLQNGVIKVNSPLKKKGDGDIIS
jgi:FlaA1/EpsC-like NDP-sugar epimerase